MLPIVKINQNSVTRARHLGRKSHCTNRTVITITDSNWPTSTKAALKARSFIDIEHVARRSISGVLAHPLHCGMYIELYTSATSSSEA